MVANSQGSNLTQGAGVGARWTTLEDSQSADLVSWEFYGPGDRVKRAVHLNGTSDVVCRENTSGLTEA